MFFVYFADLSNLLFNIKIIIILVKMLLQNEISNTIKIIL